MTKSPGIRKGTSNQSGGIKIGCINKHVLRAHGQHVKTKAKVQIPSHTASIIINLAWIKNSNKQLNDGMWIKMMHWIVLLQALNSCVFFFLWLDTLKSHFYFWLKKARAILLFCGHKNFNGTRKFSATVACIKRSKQKKIPRNWQKNYKFQQNLC